MSTDDPNVPRRPESPERLSDFLRQVVAAFRDEERSDAELLTRFARDGDQEAFRALVGRHGRSVWAVCLAVLGNSHDAEDAFQAAFMALARRAGGIDASAGVGAWVRSVARLAARKVRRGENRFGRLRDRLAANPSTKGEVETSSVDESHAWVQAAEELEGLPRRLREAVIMYHLEGRTLAQAAELLGCSLSEAHRRVICGLEKLRTRLSARGVALTAGLLAAIPTGLMTNTTLAAAALAQGLPLPSPRVAALTQAILTPRFPSWWVVVGATVLLAAGTAAALVAYPTSSSPQPLVAVTEPNAKLPVAIAADKPAKLAGRATADLSGRVTDVQGKPVAGANVSALVRRPWALGDRGLRDDVVAKVTTGADGRYALTVPADFATHYPERSIILLVSGAGIPPTTKLVRLGAGGADVGVPAPRTVRGVCAGVNGKPAGGVKLGVVRLGNAAAEPVQGGDRKLPDGWPADVVSGPDGEFRIAGLPASEDVWVEVRDDHFALSTVRFAAGESSVVKVTLAAPRVLEGRVTASDTGMPLAGARVSVFAGSWETHSKRYTAVTATTTTAADAPPVEFDTISGPDGSFRFRLPPASAYRAFIHAPSAAPYFGVVRYVKWEVNSTAQHLDVVLPKCRLVRGVMREEDGTPVIGGWVTCDAKPDNRHVTPDMLHGRQSSVRTAEDGSFVLPAPRGPVTVRGFGPTADYRPARDCPSRSVVHAFAEFDGEELTSPEPVVFTIRRGVRVPVRVIGVDGKSAEGGLAVCMPVVQTVRSNVPRWLPVRDGSFDLPGCEPDRIYSAVVLDTATKRGGVVEVRVGQTPVARLEPLGSAEVRLIDPSGKPIVGAPASLSIDLREDRPAATELSKKAVALFSPQSWFDSSQPENAVTGADGRVTLRNVIPNADYTVSFEVRERFYRAPPFRVEAGQTARLPDVVVGRPKPKEPFSEED